MAMLRGSLRSFLLAVDSDGAEENEDRGSVFFDEIEKLLKAAGFFTPAQLADGKFAELKQTLVDQRLTSYKVGAQCAMLRRAFRKATALDNDTDNAKGSAPPGATPGSSVAKPSKVVNVIEELAKRAPRYSSDVAPEQSCVDLLVQEGFFSLNSNISEQLRCRVLNYTLNSTTLSEHFGALAD